MKDLSNEELVSKVCGVTNYGIEKHTSIAELKAELLSRIKRGERAEKKLDKISEVYKTICLVKVENAPSYQELSIAFLKLCDVIKEQYKEAGNELSITFFID